MQKKLLRAYLLKCQREPEEKKIKYMGHFFSNVSFHPEISAYMAHQLCKHAEQMTYRQFCLLKLAKFDNYRPQLRDRDYRGQETFSGICSRSFMKFMISTIVDLSILEER